MLNVVSEKKEGQSKPRAVNIHIGFLLRIYLLHFFKNIRCSNNEYNRAESDTHRFSSSFYTSQVTIAVDMFANGEIFYPAHAFSFFRTYIVHWWSDSDRPLYNPKRTGVD